MLAGVLKGYDLKAIAARVATGRSDVQPGREARRRLTVVNSVYAMPTVELLETPRLSLRPFTRRTAPRCWRCRAIRW